MTDVADHDLVGVGIGPFNLGLAALANQLDALQSVFFDENPDFDWHPGLMLDGATLQVPFLADLVTFVDPTNRWSFTNYLHHHDRLFAYSFMETPNPYRAEYNHYCRWVAESLENCRFGMRVEAVRWDDEEARFIVETVSTSTGDRRSVTSRNIVVGLGSEPKVPSVIAAVMGQQVFHSSDYLQHADEIAAYRDITVVGSGQSGAEVFLDLLQRQPIHGWNLRWLTRTHEFTPLAYSKLGLERFTPDYTRFFYGLQQDVKDRILPDQWRTYNAVDQATLGAIYDLLYERTIAGRESMASLTPASEVVSVTEAGRGFQVECRHVLQDRTFLVDTDCIIAATGYQTRAAECLKPMADALRLDTAGRFCVGPDYRLELHDEISGVVFVQNAEAHTHGLSAPDLGLGAFRSAMIINAVAGREVYRIPARTAFTYFEPTAVGTIATGPE
ncbi:lysine N(6)-hydroxylase/L-ornithine N(5)-oxygenase family protein [Kribbella deserti]|uniref:L-lysine N6-monooxygenase MbtG n=1 Tax=Kribbella deserti TaxID=1926257 RepID=A0ABV6QZD3_9ACTN